MPNKYYYPQHNLSKFLIHRYSFLLAIYHVYDVFSKLLPRQGKIIYTAWVSIQFIFFGTKCCDQGVYRLLCGQNRKFQNWRKTFVCACVCVCDHNLYTILKSFGIIFLRPKPVFRNYLIKIENGDLQLMLISIASLFQQWEKRETEYRKGREVN